MKWILVLLALPALAVAADEKEKNDNTGRNASEPVTAQDQSERTADREMTAKIREAVMEDEALSTVARNIKIVTRNGKVTLAGPVKTEGEKKAIETRAAAIAGKENVINTLKTP